MEYTRNPYMVCFDASELKMLYRNDKKEKIVVKILQKKTEIRNDLIKNETMKNIADELIADDLSYTEEIEIFSAIHFSMIFDAKDTKICFAVKKDFNFRKTPINCLQDLKSALESDDLTDFALYKTDRQSYFQLKQYKGSLETADFYDFLIRMLDKYGNDIGDTNLLFQLSVPGVMQIQLEEISKMIKFLNFTFSGHILVNYNEENKYHVLVQLYPEFGVTKEKIELDYLTKEFSGS